jgi:hypothetical protein
MRFQPSVSTICILGILLLSGCRGTSAVAKESWTVIQLLSHEEKREQLLEIAEVRNCQAPEVKSVSCSAGTATNFSVSLDAEVGLNLGAEVSISPSVAEELGFDRNSGETLQLETPPQGYYYRYTIRKEFTIVVGEARVQSSTGEMKSGIYTFDAKCLLSIEDLELLTCEDREAAEATQTIATANDSSPNIIPTAIPRESAPTESVASTTDTPIPPQPTNPVQIIPSLNTQPTPVPTLLPTLVPATDERTDTQSCVASGLGVSICVNGTPCNQSTISSQSVPFKMRVWGSGNFRIYSHFGCGVTSSSNPDPWPYMDLLAETSDSFDINPLYETSDNIYVEVTDLNSNYVNWCYVFVNSIPPVGEYWVSPSPICISW